MKEITETVVEKEDWDALRNMSLEDAVKYLGGDNDCYDALKGYLGSYDFESEDTYHYYKARLYYAIDVLLKKANSILHDKTKLYVVTINSFDVRDAQIRFGEDDWRDMDENLNAYLGCIKAESPVKAMEIASKQYGYPKDRLAAFEV